ncbi:MAG: cyclic nucleotide-binding domain-containing protein [Planctomycetes bacterium]|nr:cyclic nucleotide-binding domain-containing protein [Planctomycetota bacterium]
MGMDVVSFSELHDDDQMFAIEHLMRWINEALAYQSLKHEHYRWSPGGDGGFLTFTSTAACRKAIDVAFSICEKLKHPDWIPRNARRIDLRLSLHTGPIREGDELRRETNIWGAGINTAARILSVAAPSQLLMSKQYYDTYIRGQREQDFAIGDLHWRTVKHGVKVEVLNVNRNELCLSEGKASSQRWRIIGRLWKRMVAEYTSLISDTMCSGQPVAAIAAAKFLLELKAHEPVEKLCKSIGQSEFFETDEYPRQQHMLFSRMPDHVLFEVINQIELRRVREGEVVCQQGDPAHSCFFPVSGEIVVDVPGRDEPIPIAMGQIIGEFSLWIPKIARTATVRSIDDGLLIEIHTDRLKRVLEKYPDVADAVYGLIKRRIIDNVLGSKTFFAGVPRESVRDLHSLAECRKHSPGDVLDLTSSTYIIFKGSVRIQSKQGTAVDLVSSGEFGSEQVAGIVAEIELPDGNEAKVLEETVAIAIAHETLRDVQRRFDTVRDVWNGICGRRLGLIQRYESA